MSERERLAGIILGVLRHKMGLSHLTFTPLLEDDAFDIADAILSDPAYGRAGEMREVVGMVAGMFVRETWPDTMRVYTGPHDQHITAGDVRRARALTEDGGMSEDSTISRLTRERDEAREALRDIRRLSDARPAMASIALDKIFARARAVSEKGEE